MNQFLNIQLHPISYSLQRSRAVNVIVNKISDK